ncbi:MAG: DUF1189 family protein, partial [Sphaerochaetaceae bacterium]|nr:DUF1189 family protein [Sphaerochaetaceae bacterium]
EPYFIKIPNQWKADQYIDIQSKNIENIVVIDTKSSITAETFNLYNTFVLLGKDSIAYMDNGKISMVPLAEFDNFAINRGIILDLINNIKPFFSYLYPLAIIGAIIFGYMAVVGKIFYLIFGALLIWLVIKIMGTNIGYKKSYQIGLHLITLPIIIVSVLNFIPFRITFAFLFSIILVLSTVLNFRNNNIGITEKNIAI